MLPSGWTTTSLGELSRLPWNLLGDDRDAAVRLVADDAAAAVLARELPPLVVEGVAVAVARRVPERRHAAVVVDPAHLHVVRDVAPHQVAADAVPGRALRPTSVPVCSRLIERVARRCSGGSAGRARRCRDRDSAVGSGRVQSRGVGTGETGPGGVGGGRRRGVAAGAGGRRPRAAQTARRDGWRFPWRQISCQEARFAQAGRGARQQGAIELSVYGVSYNTTREAL